jgi:hypothetical protein
MYEQISTKINFLQKMYLALAFYHDIYLILSRFKFQHKFSSLQLVEEILTALFLVTLFREEILIYKSCNSNRVVYNLIN